MALLSRARPFCGCWAVVLSLTVSLRLLPAGYGKHFAPFFDPDCTRDCSWPYSKNGIPASQFCELATSRPDGLTDQCHNPFKQPPGFSDRPSKPENVRATDFNKEVRSDSGEVEQYTCVTITFNLLQYAAEKIKGLQLSLRPLSIEDLNRFYCINLNFSESGLNYFAVLDDHEKQADLSFSCFCGLMPGSIYRIAIRTMPVDITNGSVHNTIKEIDHQPPACSDPSKRNDVRCLKSPAAQWEPQCISVKQNTSTLDYHGNYDLVEVSFEAAPDSYCFSSYDVYIYEKTTNRLVDWTQVDMKTASIMNQSCSGRHTRNVPFVMVRFDSTIGYEDLPWPSPGTGLYVRILPFNLQSCKTCKDGEGSPSSCRTSFKQDFFLIDDPCRSNPCGWHGECNSNEERYSCVCLPGYMNWEGTCAVDHCQSGVKFTSPCGVGECKNTPDRDDYICYCPENYLNTGKTCLADPCYANPETNTTPCGVHGQCNQNFTNESVSHICLCAPGYSSQANDICKEVARPVWIVVLVAGSCTAGLFLFVLLLCFVTRNRFFQCFKVEEQTVPCANHNSRDERASPSISYTPVNTHPEPKPDEKLHHRRVLPIFSEDHPKHKDAVVNLCRLLQQHLNCDMSLLDWHASVGFSVEMWLASEIEKADVVLLLCSKGTGVKYEAKANRDKVPTDSLSEYGDVFVKALTMLDDYFSRDNADKKFVVAYFDYSSVDDIPVTFRRFATFRLMQCMEKLFFRIHGMMRDSPHSSRRVPDLDRYQNLEMGKPLHRAINAMRELIKSDSSWYENHAVHNRRHSSGASGYFSDPQASMPSQQSRAPSWFFDKVSSGHGSSADDFDNLLEDFDNSLPASQGKDAAKTSMLQQLHPATSSASLPEMHLATSSASLPETHLATRASDSLPISDSGFA